MRLRISEAVVISVGSILLGATVLNGGCVRESHPESSASGISLSSPSSKPKLSATPSSTTLPAKPSDNDYDVADKESGLDCDVSKREWKDKPSDRYTTVNHILVAKTPIINRTNRPLRLAVTISGSASSKVEVLANRKVETVLQVPAGPGTFPFETEVWKWGTKTASECHISIVVDSANFE